ncbi:MAG: hypothetical protein HN576_00640 [Bacteriovoracaceae bacterium]|nr:hypothetical protein [Bacteriovoracaceae bacterium]
MSRHETWRTKEYFKKFPKDSILLEEFMAVRRSKDNGQRLIDGLIVLKPSKKDPKNIKGKDVVVIQTKAKRLGMYLLGQAFFSTMLIKKFKPKSVRTIAICAKSDVVMEKLAKQKGIEVVIIPDKK